MILHALNKVLFADFRLLTIGKINDFTDDIIQTIPIHFIDEFGRVVGGLWWCWR